MYRLFMEYLKRRSNMRQERVQCDSKFSKLTSSGSRLKPRYGSVGALPGHHSSAPKDLVSASHASKSPLCNRHKIVWSANDTFTYMLKSDLVVRSRSALSLCHLTTLCLGMYHQNTPNLAYRQALTNLRWVEFTLQ